MALFGAAKAPAVPDAKGATVGKLTDSTSGTADGTVADVSTAVTGVDGTGSNAASKADVDARLAAINDNFAELTQRLNALIDHLNDGRA